MTASPRWWLKGSGLSMWMEWGASGRRGTAPGPTLAEGSHMSTIPALRKPGFPPLPPTVSTSDAHLPASQQPWAAKKRGWLLGSHDTGLGGCRISPGALGGPWNTECRGLGIVSHTLVTFPRSLPQAHLRLPTRL